MTDEVKVSSSSQGPTAVLIVGAGPTGLTLACELARRGVAFRIIEAAAGPQPGSRGKGLQSRTLEVFDNLGIVDRVLANGRMAMPMRSIAMDGQVTLRGGEALVMRPDIPYPASLITPEWRVEEALRLRLEEFGSSVEFGTALESLRQLDGVVSAVLTKGATRETVDALWLVGCDGGHSLVRKQAGIAFEGETRDDVRMIVADVRADGLDWEAWYMWSHEEGLFSLCPLPSTDHFQLQASIAPGQDAELSLINMQTLLERRTGRTDIRLRSCEWHSLWRANVRLVDRYLEGRVFLAGDSAHIHSPAGGQGMNTGIQDAQNLGWKLAAVLTGNAHPSLLDSYQAERRPVAASVIAFSDARLQEAIQQKSIPARRDAGMMQLGIHYRGSSFAQDDRDSHSRLRAGDRAPDAPDLMTRDGKCRLFDLTRHSRFTLLNFGVDASAVTGFSLVLKVLNVVRDPTSFGEIADCEGHLTEAYSAKLRTLVLIRPDGYVGLISDAGDVSAIANYMAAVG